MNRKTLFSVMAAIILSAHAANFAAAADYMPIIPRLADKTLGLIALFELLAPTCERLGRAPCLFVIS